MAFAQSEMLQKEVFLFERLDSVRSNEKLKYLKCIVFIRPTKDNIFMLQQELQSPKFGSYYICKYASCLPMQNETDKLCPGGPRFQQHYTTDRHKNSGGE